MLMYTFLYIHALCTCPAKFKFDSNLRICTSSILRSLRGRMPHALCKRHNLWKLPLSNDLNRNGKNDSHLANVTLTDSLATN